MRVHAVERAFRCKVYDKMFTDLNLWTLYLHNHPAILVGSVISGDFCSNLCTHYTLTWQKYCTNIIACVWICVLGWEADTESYLLSKVSVFVNLWKTVMPGFWLPFFVCFWMLNIYNWFVIIMLRMRIHFLYYCLIFSTSVHIYSGFGCFNEQKFVEKLSLHVSCESVTCLHVKIQHCSITQ